MEHLGLLSVERRPNAGPLRSVPAEPGQAHVAQAWNLWRRLEDFMGKTMGKPSENEDVMGQHGKTI